MAASSGSDEKKPKAAPAKGPAAGRRKAVKKAAARKKTAKKKTAKKKAVARKKKAAATRRPGQVSQVSPKERYEMIAKMAYFRAEKRGFEPGWEQEDWLESERLIDEMLKNMGR